MTRTFTPLAALAAAALLSTPAFAGAVQGYAHANHAMHQDMDIRYSGNPDVDFARGMIPHHQGAVDMAEVELKYGKDEELKALARRIITWQKAEIGFMKQWLSGRDGSWGKKNRKAIAGYIDAMDAMHHNMAIPYTGDADVDFARGMIPHHQGAIDMAWVLKQYGTDPALRDMADDIIRGQAQEIKLMQQWLDKRPAPKSSHKKIRNKQTQHDRHAHH